MFYYPNLFLTDYEKERVRLYSNGEKPGVLRRTYSGILNTATNPLIPEIIHQHLTARVQISRRARVFMLSFAGDASLFRMHISRANGEHYTATNPGAPQQPSAFPSFTGEGADAPIVAAMCPGSFFSPLSALGVPPPEVETTPALGTSSDYRLPMVVEPNWQLDPNDILIFQGYPLTEDPIILEIGIHVWEFPDWEGC